MVEAWSEGETTKTKSELRVTDLIPGAISCGGEVLLLSSALSVVVWTDPVRTMPGGQWGLFSLYLWSVRLYIRHTSCKMNHLHSNYATYFHKMQNAVVILSQETQYSLCQTHFIPSLCLSLSFSLSLSLSLLSLAHSITHSIGLASSLSLRFLLSLSFFFLAK